MIIKIIIDIICGVLGAWGGYSWHNAKRYLFPTLLAISISYFTGVWWLGAVVLPNMGIETLGYFSNKNWGRALWLFLQALTIGIILVLLGHLIWWNFLIYILGAGVLGGLYKNWEQWIGDFCAYAYLGSIIFMVR